MSVERVIDTNPNCFLKTNILCDRSEPTIVFDLIPKVCGKIKLICQAIEMTTFSFELLFCSIPCRGASTENGKTAFNQFNNVGNIGVDQQVHHTFGASRRSPGCS